MLYKPLKTSHIIICSIPQIKPKWSSISTCEKTWGLKLFRKWFIIKQTLTWEPTTANKSLLVCRNTKPANRRLLFLPQLLYFKNKTMSKLLHDMHNNKHVCHKTLSHGLDISSQLRALSPVPALRALSPFELWATFIKYFFKYQQEVVGTWIH